MSLNMCVCVCVCVCEFVSTEHFLTDGNISVNIAVTGPPVITANYIESYHKVNNGYEYNHDCTNTVKRLWFMGDRIVIHHFQ